MRIGPHGDRRDSVSASAVNAPPASPVLTTLLGSSRSTAVSVSAPGQRSAPRGTTNSSRKPRTTSRSRIWMVTSPLSMVLGQHAYQVLLAVGPSPQTIRCGLETSARHGRITAGRVKAGPGARPPPPPGGGGRGAGPPPRGGGVWWPGGGGGPPRRAPPPSPPRGAPTGG